MFVTFFALPFRAAASPPPAIVEIDPRAPLDARAARRLVQLELADVEVPKRPQDPEVALFVRVLAADEERLRVELWERGEAYGARLVSGTRESSQLIARRVALAAAELARGLRQKRRSEARARLDEERRRRLVEQAERERTLDGPAALRPSVTGTLVGLGDLAVVGPSLTGELNVSGATRLDLSAAASFGPVLDGGANVEVFELGLAPAHRFVLVNRSLDLDVSAFAKAGVLSFTNVESVDGLAGQHQTWWARAGAATAAEFRLERTTRLSLGLALGAVIRRVPLTLENGEERRLGGFFVGAELGVVFTPPVVGR
ncbi:MAG TPA: hypothetical protein VFZ53_05865 [Polyangiaceae bacterium]